MIPRLLPAVAVVAVGIGACSATSDDPRAVRSDRTASSTDSPVEATLPATDAAAPLRTQMLVDVGPTNVPTGMSGLPGGDAGAIAAALLPDGFPVPAGPNVVTRVMLDTVVETEYYNTIGTEVALPGAAAQHPTDDRRGQRRDCGGAAHRAQGRGRAVQGVIALGVGMVRRLTSEEQKLTQLPTRVADELAAELALSAAMSWRLSGYSYERSVGGTLDRAGLLADVSGNSQVAADRFESATTVTARSEEDGTTVFETPDGVWRIKHDDWPGATASFERRS